MTKAISIEEELIDVAVPSFMIPKKSTSKAPTAKSWIQQNRSTNNRRLEFCDRPRPEFCRDGSEEKASCTSCTLGDDVICPPCLPCQRK